MPTISPEGAGSYFEPIAIGPVAQFYPPVSPPAQLAAGGSQGASFTVGPLRSDGFKVLTVSAQLAAAGSISIQRFVDLAGKIAQGPATTLALAAGTLGVVNLTDGLPYGSFAVTVTNNGSSAAALSSLAILQTAA